MPNTIQIVSPTPGSTVVVGADGMIEAHGTVGFGTTEPLLKIYGKIFQGGFTNFGQKPFSWHFANGGGIVEGIVDSDFMTWHFQGSQRLPVPPPIGTPGSPVPKRLVVWGDFDNDPCYDLQACSFNAESQGSGSGSGASAPPAGRIAGAPAFKIAPRQYQLFADPVAFPGVSLGEGLEHEALFGDGPILLAYDEQAGGPAEPVWRCRTNGETDAEFTLQVASRLDRVQAVLALRSSRNGAAPVAEWTAGEWDFGGRNALTSNGANGVDWSLATVFVEPA